MKIVLNILREEILSSDYISRNCPISRALARAGYPQLADVGTGILDENSLKKVCIESDPAYCELGQRVRRMCRREEEPVDFTVELEINLKENVGVEGTIQEL